MRSLAANSMERAVVNEGLPARPRELTRMLGVPIDRAALPELMQRAAAALDRGQTPLVVACANPHSLVLAQHDHEFREALEAADAVIADGFGIILAACLARRPIGPRITGSDFFLATMSLLEARGGGRVYFFGSTPQVLAAIEARVTKEFPRVMVCGTHSPPFRTWTERENSEMVGHINAMESDVLWVGMTAPKQERWVQRNRTRLAVPIVGSVGAVFDYYGGQVTRPPRWARAAGLEWLVRLCGEPRRLWRRTFVSAPRFLLLVVSEALFGSRSGQ